MRFDGATQLELERHLTDTIDLPMAEVRVYRDLDGIAVQVTLQFHSFAKISDFALAQIASHDNGSLITMFEREAELARQSIIEALHDYIERAEVERE